MLKALDENQNVFVEAFVTVKKQQNADEGSSDDGRIDMVKVNQFDKIVQYLSSKLTIDFSEFEDFFHSNYSQLANGGEDQTISLAQFTQVYLEYIEVSLEQKQLDMQQN